MNQQDAVITPHIGDYQTFRHKGEMPLDDEIHYSKALPTMSKQILVETDRGVNDSLLYTKDLAGDIAKEYSVLPVISDKSFRYIKEFLVTQFSHIWGRRVVDLEFSVDPKNKKRGGVWINYMERTEYNPLHKHGGLYSFVWYLKIPEAIRREHLAQKTAGMARGLIEFIPSSNTASLRFNPNTNDVFIFRATHQHLVYPFYSEAVRVSMSGNISKLVFNDGSFVEAVQEAGM
jgi:hypothetical protein